ncbi:MULTISPECIES: hypothetical protein [unclassified Clostridium]|uniref:hypothetical protein n=1 Tax=unclassified Clostridium TaxID=2614128 RepID=UPI0025BF058B|nr:MULTISPECIES: hypothetical protein [unclassified Clostridium]
MLKESKTLKIHDIFSIISKSTPDEYCVFIRPSDLVEPDRAIKELGLKCDINDLDCEELLIEKYDNLKEAKIRVALFKYKWSSYFYVSMYKNGECVMENI